MAAHGLNLDVGFGSVGAVENRKRLVNRDGTVNLRREGLGFLDQLSGYHYFLPMSWRLFLTYVAAAYIASNALFALIYGACGPHTLNGFTNETLAERFGQAFFFRVHMLATFCHCNIAPAAVSAGVFATEPML